MIFCYSASHNSKTYADILSGITGHKVYMLETDLASTSRLSFIACAIWSVITKKPITVTNMPGPDVFANFANFAGFAKQEEFYICGPIWGGYPAGPLRYFLQNAPLKDKKVHMLLTAGMSHDKYPQKSKEMLIEAGIIPGKVEVFAVNSKTPIEQDVVESHIRTLMFEDEE